MSRRNGKSGKGQHDDILKPSDQDLITLCEAVEQRFLELTASYLRANHVELVVPGYLDKDMLNWRTLAVRYKSGDFRNKIDEKKSLRRIADWTHRENCLLRNQKHIPIQWKD